jgi:hypothetical protein
MGKSLTLLLIVLGLWAYTEIQFKGTQGAFGGALAGVFAPIGPVRAEGEPPPSPITHQVRDRVSGVMAQYERDRLRQTAEGR